MSSSSPPFIVDSHVHLWEADDLDKLAWCTADSPLAHRCSPRDYVAAVNSKTIEQEREEEEEEAQGEGGREGGPVGQGGRNGASAFVGPRVGYIFIESDRKNGNDGSDWTQPLAEVAYLRSIIEAETDSEQARCLAIVPWAPVHRGAEELERYLAQVEETAGPLAWARVRAFRYLVQDKPRGTMLTDAFVEGLKLLGRRGFAFDLGIDQHRRGRVQMEEAVELLDRVHSDVADDSHKVTLIVNHLAKPDLTVLNPQADRGYNAWRSAMFAFASASPRHVYVKVSGLFSEMPDALRDQSATAFLAAAFPWLAVLLAAFGPSRLMFGSDWPVCTARYAGATVADAATAAAAAAEDDKDAPAINKAEAGAWNKWRSIVSQLCYMADLNEEDQAMLWGGTAVQAYGLIKNDE